MKITAGHRPKSEHNYSLLGRLLYCMNCHLAAQQLRMLRKLIICKKAESAIICRATRSTCIYVASSRKLSASQCHWCKQLKARTYTKRQKVAASAPIWEVSSVLAPWLARPERHMFLLFGALELDSQWTHKELYLDWFSSYKQDLVSGFYELCTILLRL